MDDFLIHIQFKVLRRSCNDILISFISPFLLQLVCDLIVLLILFLFYFRDLMYYFLSLIFVIHFAGIRSNHTAGSSQV